MVLSNNLSNLVTRMAKQNGQQMTLTTSGSESGTYDPSTGTFSSTKSTYQVNGIVLDLTFIAYSTKPEANTLIQESDKRVLLDGSKLPITIRGDGFSLTFAGSVWKIVSVKEINPTGASSIMYDLIVRK